MATHEEKHECVVLVRLEIFFGGLQRLFFDRERASHLLLAAAARGFAAHVIAQTPQGDFVKPAARVVRYTFELPLLRCGKQRLLSCVLRRCKIAMASRERAEHLRREVTQQLLDASRVC
jgi:hypothetical protein